MKTAISIPDTIFRSAEEFARKSKVSRSELYTKALTEYLKKHREHDATKALNEVYAGESSAMDPILTKLQDISIFTEEW